MRAKAFQTRQQLVMPQFAAVTSYAATNELDESCVFGTQNKGFNGL